ncbi:MAG: GNAT family N-acetyltransferase [Curtobacterium sp.]
MPGPIRRPRRTHCARARRRAASCPRPCQPGPRRTSPAVLDEHRVPVRASPSRAAADDPYADSGAHRAPTGRRHRHRLVGRAPRRRAARRPRTARRLRRGPRALPDARCLAPGVDPRGRRGRGGRGGGVGPGRGGAPHTTRPEGDARWIEHVYLAPEVQGRGIGSAVLRAVLDEPHAGPTRLNVLQGSAARRLYERLGFVLDEEDDVDVFMTLRVGEG